MLVSEFLGGLAVLSFVLGVTAFALYARDSARAKRYAAYGTAMCIVGIIGFVAVGVALNSEIFLVAMLFVFPLTPLALFWGGVLARACNDYAIEHGSIRSDSKMISAFYLMLVIALTLSLLLGWLPI